MTDLSGLCMKVNRSWEAGALSLAEAHALATAMVHRGRVIYRNSLALLHEEPTDAPAIEASHGTT